MIRAFSLVTLAMVAIIVHAAPAFGEWPQKNKSKLQAATENLKIIGAITKNVGGKSVGIVVVKDKTTSKTQAVQIGQVFTVGKQALRIVKQNGKALVFSDGKEMLSVTYNNGTPINSDWGSGTAGTTYTQIRSPNRFTEQESEAYDGQDQVLAEESAPRDTGVSTSLDRIQKEMAEVEIGGGEEPETAMATDKTGEEEAFE